MGDYADMAMSDGIDDWRGGDRRVQMWGNPRDFPPQYSGKRPKRCQRCGAGPLYWEREAGKWRLHAYGAQGYVPHRCDSDGAATAAETACPAPAPNSAAKRGSEGHRQGDRP